MEKDYCLFLDFYLLTMSQVYFNSGKKDTVAVFDAFFRKEPLNAGYGVMAGVDKIIEHVKNLKFSDSDIEYLKSLNKFSEDFLEYLKNFKFTGDISAIPDGTPVFGNEPILTVKAPIIEAQILETALLSYLNSNICWATATKKVTEAAKEIEVMEFGGRRGMGPQAAIDASKCAVMAGAIGTSNTIAGKEHGIKSLGTMAHSLVEFFPTEYDSFMDYAKTFPNDSIFLVDTFNTLKSGVPNAINVAQDYLMPNGHRLKGIRIDSGDLAYLSKKAREMLDEVDLKDAKICISNGLDDKTIESLRNQGAPIDIIGLGDNIVLP